MNILSPLIVIKKKKPETFLFNPLFLQFFVDSIFEWLLILLVIDSLFSVSQNSPTFLT